MRSLLLLGGVFWAGAYPLRGADPVLTHIHPAGVQQGTSVAVKLTGKFDPWPCKVRADSPGISFVSGADAGKFTVTVAGDVAPGPHLIRAFDDEGASAPISMVIASVPQTLEVEPNDHIRSPQVLATSTTTCNGRMDKVDDVDSYLVNLKKGQVMVARVEAHVLAAGFDPMLRVLDSSVLVLGFNHDHTTMDPFLVFEAPRDGGYVVQTMGHKYPASSDVKFAGGDDCTYRLHVSTEPFVRNTWPLAVQRGRKTQMALEGWNLSSTQLEIDDAAPPPFPVTFSDVPELTETMEPQTLEIPSAISGRIGAAGDEDRFAFTAAKDSVIELAVTGPRHGSAIDAWLKVLDKDGKELASNDDDGGSSEPRIVWTAPADGTYTAVVGDLTQRGGNEFFYRLMITRPAPVVSASIATHAVKVAAGKSAELKVAVKLANGFQPKLKLAAKNLPAGITAAEVDVSEKGGEVALTLTAEATAPRASQPFQLVLREVEGAKDYPVEFSMVSTGDNNGAPQGYRQLLINSTDQLWLTVTAPPPPPPAPPTETKAAP